MFKRIFIATILISIVAVFLCFNKEKGSVYKFRTTTDIISDPAVNTKGLAALRVSGSRLISLPELAKNLQSVNAPIYIVDPISGVHGYVNGYPDSYFVEHTPHKKPKPWYKNLKYTFRRLYYTGTIDFKRDERWLSAEAAAKHQGYNYFHLSLDVDGKKRFRLEELIRFAEFAESLPQDAWVHAHCIHGCSRTTLVMCTLDMLANAPDVSVADIVRRQYVLGGVDLFDVTPFPNGSYTAADLEARKQIVIDLYNHIVEKKLQKRLATAA